MLVDITNARTYFNVSDQKLYRWVWGYDMNSSVVFQKAMSEEPQVINTWLELTTG